MHHDQYLRGLVRPATVDTKARTVELIASTGSWFQRMDAAGAFLEALEISAEAIDLSRVEGMPLLDSHRQDGLDNVLGVVRRARVENGSLIVTVEFSERAEAVWKDVVAGIIRNVSVGYEVSRWADSAPGADRMRRRTATRWTPLEVSIVPVGADPSAKVRGTEVTTPETNPTTPPAVVTPPAVTPSTRGAVNAQIRAMAATMGLGADFTDPLIDRDATLEAAQSEAIRVVGERRANAPVAHTVTIATNDDPILVARRMGEAIYATRVNAGHKLSDAAKPYVGLTILDMARSCLQTRGMSHSGLSAAETITRAGMITTGDFSAIFADTANRTLRDGYTAIPNILKTLGRQTTAKDFRKKISVQFEDNVSLEKVNEKGEYKHGGFVEAKESYGIKTYGKILAVSRQALINDDLGAFTDMAGKLGRAAAEFEADFLVDLVTSGSGNGPTMNDTKALFHADHGNKAASGGVPAENTLSAARLAMRKQTGINSRPLNVAGKYILTPPDLETTVDKLLTTIQASQSSNVNPFAGKLEQLTDARLTNATRWYIVADPSQIAGLEYAYLLGEEGPQTFTRDGFDVDGVEVKVRLDFGAGFVDWRGWYMNAGA